MFVAAFVAKQNSSRRRKSISVPLFNSLRLTTCALLGSVVVRVSPVLLSSLSCSGAPTPGPSNNPDRPRTLALKHRRTLGRSRCAVIRARPLGHRLPLRPGRCLELPQAASRSNRKAFVADTRAPPSVNDDDVVAASRQPAVLPVAVRYDREAADPVRRIRPCTSLPWSRQF